MNHQQTTLQCYLMKWLLNQTKQGNMYQNIDFSHALPLMFVQDKSI